jgi:hypothetical protein
VKSDPSPWTAVGLPVYTVDPPPIESMPRTACLSVREGPGQVRLVGSPPDVELKVHDLGVLADQLHPGVDHHDVRHPAVSGERGEPGWAIAAPRSMFPRSDAPLLP